MILAPTPENIIQAAEALSSGELVSFPTETVYGLGANALDAAAVEKIYSLKGRPASNPLIVHVASVDAARALFARDLEPIVESRFQKISRLWPGPLSIVAPKALNIPECVTANQPLVAVRIPNHPVAIALLKAVKLPIAAPSANRSNYVSPTTAHHVRDDFGEALPIILDGGECRIGLESTVVSIHGERPVILRLGGIVPSRIEEVLGEKLGTPGAIQPAVSPGMMNLHYSPRTPLYLRGDEPALTPNTRSGLIQFDASGPAPSAFSRVVTLSPDGDLEQVAQGLYAALRELDQSNLDFIVVDECESEGLGLAIMDRISRAQGSACNHQKTTR